MPTEPRTYDLKPSKIRNATREPDVIVRECKKCLKVYKGNGQICPYCGFNNGKTRQQIEYDEKMELERVTEIQRKQARIEVGMCKDLNSLIELGKRRGYKNPKYWAMMILTARNEKIKKI